MSQWLQSNAQQKLCPLRN